MVPTFSEPFRRFISKTLPWTHSLTNVHSHPSISSVPLPIHHILLEIQCNNFSTHEVRTRMFTRKKKDFLRAQNVSTINQNNVEFWNVYVCVCECRTIDVINAILKWVSIYTMYWTCFNHTARWFTYSVCVPDAVANETGYVCSFTSSASAPTSFFVNRKSTWFCCVLLSLVDQTKLSACCVRIRERLFGINL